MGVYSSVHETHASFNRDIKDGSIYWADFDTDYFDKGTYRYAFCGTFHGIGPRDGTLCVTKVFKKEFAHLFDKQFRTDHAISIKAQRFAELFTKTVLPSLKYKLSTSRIEFIIPLVAKIDSLSHFKLLGLFHVAEDRTYLDPCDYISIEPFIKGKYEKYNSNGGHEDRSSVLLNAFSHWTWHISGYKYLVCDLQGVHEGGKYTLTDPCIHSIDGRFGATDLGVVGMERFFANHHCNIICKTLKLENPVRDTSATPRFTSPIPRRRPTTYRFQLTEHDLFRARMGKSRYINLMAPIVK